MTTWTWRGMPLSRAGVRNTRRSRAGSRRPARSGRRAAGRTGALALGSLDGGVLSAAAVLAGLGLVMVFSATAPLASGQAFPTHFTRHLGGLAAGVLLAACALRVPLNVWRRLALPLWAGCLGLLALTLALGIEANGAQRWLPLPGLPFSLQPAEFCKWATALAVAAALSDLGDKGTAKGRGIRIAALLVIPPAILLLLQPDLGNTAVLVALVGLLLFAAGTPLLKLAMPAIVAAAATGVYVALKPYALARMRGFFHPWETARDEGFQLVQSFVAFGRGGTTGVGLGDGRQKLFYLPEAHTDFILSVVAEELGLLGVLIVLGAFTALVVAGTRIARRAEDRFALLVAFGMTALVALPAAVNGAVVMGLVPTTGLTLPFLSFGTNSLVMCSLAIGILLRIAAFEGRS